MVPIMKHFQDQNVQTLSSQFQDDFHENDKAFDVILIDPQV